MVDAGRSAIVTGANSGIGAALVGRLLRSGHRVLAIDRAFDGGDGDEPGLRRITGDVTDPGVLAGAVAAIDGEIDLVVNSAAVRPTGPAVEVTDDDWRRCLDVNVIAAAGLIRAASPRLRDGGAAIVNVASGAAWGKSPLAAYGASKAALISYSRTLASELAPRRIRVNVVVPGTTDTGMLRSARASGTGTSDSTAPRNFGGRVLDADAVAADIERVAALEQVTGAVVPVGLLPWEW